MSKPEFTNQMDLRAMSYDELMGSVRVEFLEGLKATGARTLILLKEGPAAKAESVRVFDSMEMRRRGVEVPPDETIVLELLIYDGSLCFSWRVFIRKPSDAGVLAQILRELPEPVRRDLESHLAHTTRSMRRFGAPMLEAAQGCITMANVIDAVRKGQTAAEAEAPLAARLRFPRSHERLRQEATRDPVFLFQSRQIWWAPVSELSWDSDADVMRYAEHTYDAGSIVSVEVALAHGWAFEWWRTETVFASREDGEEWGKKKAYNYPDGWRVYCVAAEGDMIDVLAEATMGGRYG